MTELTTADRWKKYLVGEKLSWFDPERFTKDYCEGFKKSECITKILKLGNIPIGQAIKRLEPGCGTALYSVIFALLGLVLGSIFRSKTDAETPAYRRARVQHDYFRRRNNIVAKPSPKGFLWKLRDNR